MIKKKLKLKLKLLILCKIVTKKENQQLLDYITNLQQENKRLKNRWRKYNQKIEDYKSRNEKAIEYGRELRLFDNESVEFEIGTNFINILQGSDKD